MSDTSEDWDDAEMEAQRQIILGRIARGEVSASMSGIEDYDPRVLAQRRALRARSQGDQGLRAMDVITRAIMSAEPVEGFPVPDAERDTWRYGKDCALTAAREALYEWESRALDRDGLRALVGRLRKAIVLYSDECEFGDGGRFGDIRTAADAIERLSRTLSEEEVGRLREAIQKALREVRSYVRRAIDDDKPLDAIVALDVIDDIARAALASTEGEGANSAPSPAAHSTK